MHFFVREPEIDPLREQLRRARGLRRRDLAIELAWYLRQTDTNESLALADEAERLGRRLALGATSRRDDRPATLRIALIRGESLWLRGDYDAADACAEALQAEPLPEGDDVAVDIAFLRASVAADRGDGAARDRHLGAALTLATGLRDDQRRAIAAARLAQWQALRASADACESLRLEMEAIVASRDPVRATWAHDVRATLAKQGGDEGGVIDALVSAHAAARESGQNRRVVTAAVNLVTCFNNLRLFSSAGDWLGRALDASAANAWPLTTALCLVATAQGLKLQHKLDPALAALQSAIDVLAPLPETNFCRLNAISSMADVHLQRGDHLAALHAFEQLIAIAKREQLPHLLPLAMTERAVALARLGRLDEGLAAAGEALATIGAEPATGRRHQALWALGRVHRLRAEAAESAEAAAEAGEQALRCLVAAYETGTKVADYTLEPAFLDELAAAHAASGDPSSAYRIAVLSRAAVAAQQATHSVDQMTALELRARTEASAAEAAVQRRLAQTEAARNAVLSEFNQTLQALSEVGRTLAGSRDMASLFVAVCDGLRQFVDAPQVAIWQLDAGGATLRLRHVAGDGAAQAPASVALDDPGAEHARCARERRESLVRVHASGPGDAGSAGQDRCMVTRLLLPLVVDDRLTGLIGLQSNRAEAYEGRARVIVRMLCAHIAVALDNATAYEQLDRSRQQFEAISLRERAARAQAEAATDMKSRFLATVSHELRAPLNAILGFGQLLAGEAAAAGDRRSAQRRAVATIASAGNHLLAMANDLLDLSQIELGVVTMRPSPVDLLEVLTDAIGFMQVAAEAAGIAITVDAFAEPQAMVVADPTRLRQVAINLVSNAIKYNRPGGSVAVSVERSGEGLRLVVADTGQGMSPAQLAEIFQPFNRLGREESRTEGVGIGLTITERLVRLMKGSIAVTSTPGAGSRFTVELPAAPGAQAAAPAAPQSPGPSTHRGIAASTATEGRVLYIDDDPLGRLLMSACVERRPAVELRLSESGAGGLELIPAFRPHLVLLDLNMPGLSGLQVLQAIRQRELAQGQPPTRIVAVSGDAGARHIDAALAAGFDAYLTKPVDARALLAEVDFALRQACEPSRREA